MTSNEWINCLERLQIPPPSFPRPFICDGLPQNHKVIVIGNSPSRDVEVDWWSFWSEDGFDYKRFNKEYTNHFDESKTRKNFINPIVNNLKPITIVETNASMSKHAHKYSNREIVKTLLENMPNLTAIIAFGRYGRKLAGKLGKLRRYIRLSDESIFEFKHPYARISNEERKHIFYEAEIVCEKIKLSHILSC